MASSWVYVAIGVIIGSIVLGVVAINVALDQEPKFIDTLQQEVEPRLPAHEPEELLIDIDEDALLFHEGNYFAVLRQGYSTEVPLVLQSHTDRKLELQLSVTYGAGNAPPVLPNGIRAEFDKKSMELLAREKIPVSLALEADEDAQDATYYMSIHAMGKDTGIGTSFILVVGKGSTFAIGPDNIMKHSPVQNFTKTETWRGDIKAVLTINKLAFNDEDNVNVELSLVNTGDTTRIIGYDYTVMTIQIEKLYEFESPRSPKVSIPEWRDIVAKNDIDGYLMKNHTYTLEPNKPVSMSLTWNMTLPSVTVCHEDGTCVTEEKDILEYDNKFRAIAFIRGTVTPWNEIYDEPINDEWTVGRPPTAMRPFFIVTDPIEFVILDR